MERKYLVSIALAIALVALSFPKTASAADCGLLGWIVGCDPLTAGTQQEAMQQETARYTADVNAAAAIRAAEIQAQADLNAAQWNTTALIQTSNNSVAIEALRNQTSANNTQTAGLLAVAIVVAAGMMGGAYMLAGRRQPAPAYAPQPVRVLGAARESAGELDVARAFTQICAEERVQWRRKGSTVEVYDPQRGWVRVPNSKMLTMVQDKGLM